MIDFGVLIFGGEARVMAVGSAPASRSVNNRTDLCPAEIKIEKWRARPTPESELLPKTFADSYADIVKEAKVDDVQYAAQPLADGKTALVRGDVAAARKAAQDMAAVPGARLGREWRGRTHSVTMTYAGTNYPSLTKIAKKITGAHWSGPRYPLYEFVT